MSLKTKRAEEPIFLEVVPQSCDLHMYHEDASPNEDDVSQELHVMKDLGIIQGKIKKRSKLRVNPRSRMPTSSRERRENTDELDGRWYGQDIVTTNVV